MHARRWPFCIALATLAAGPALAGTAQRDKDWDALMAEVKKHGGEETQYKTSVSSVFRNSDGEFVTFTRMLDTPTRAVCVLTENQNLTVCGNWDTGKLRYGWRADADSPWSYGDAPPPDPPKGVFESLLAKFHDIMGLGTKWTARTIRLGN